jgi:tyrosine-specific transport protein
MKSFFSASAVLIGAIIGAGIFGIPYVISMVGILPALAYFFILGGAALLIHLFFGEIVLRTVPGCRVIGCAEKYGGRKEKFLMTLSFIIGMVGALLAYSILGGQFLKIILGTIFPSLSFPYFFPTLFFVFLLSFFLVNGMKTAAPFEIFTNICFISIIFLIFCFGFSEIDVHNFTLIEPGNLFLPFGVIMFSLIGWTAIPEIREILKTREDRKKLKKIIIFSTLFCVLFYLAFSLAVWGISGKYTSEDALAGLVPFLGQRVVFFGAIAAFFTLADSFLITGISLKNTLVCDLKINKNLTPLLVLGLPLALFFAGFQNFIETIGFIGTILGVVDGVIIIIMYRNSKKKPDCNPEYSLNIPAFLIYLLVLIFIIGGIAQVFCNN